MASKAAKQNDQQWIAEAIVDFLRGPLYVNPLMEFIDQHCDIFTTEQENKLEYTTVHQEFQARVDELLTNFLEELGVSVEEFYQVAEQSTDKLTSFVVQTILTVDDFCLFKAMMVKRNIDLGNQVLEAVDQLKAVVQQANRNAEVSKKAGDRQSQQMQPADEQEALQQAIQMSKAEYEKDSQLSKLQQIMRSLQLQDEDVATAIAIAESLKDSARQQSEAAELEQALALSVALKAEQKRLATSEQAAKLAGGISSLDAGSSSAVTNATSSSNVGDRPSESAAVTGKDSANASVPTGNASKLQTAAAYLLSQPLPERAPLRSSLPTLASGTSSTSNSSSSLPPLRTSNPAANSSNATRLAAIAAADAEAAALLRGNGNKPVQGTGADAGLRPSAVDVNVPRPTLQETRTSETGSFKHAGIHSRPLGFKGAGRASSGTDKAAIWEAAAAAAATQKNLVSNSRDGGDKETDAATAWLQDAKRQLIEKKRQEREAEMNAYQATKANNPVNKANNAPTVPSATSNEDARRAALRDKLAQRFRQDLINQSQ